MFGGTSRRWAWLRPSRVPAVPGLSFKTIAVLSDPVPLAIGMVTSSPHFTSGPGDNRRSSGPQPAFEPKRMARVRGWRSRYRPGWPGPILVGGGLALVGLLDSARPPDQPQRPQLPRPADPYQRRLWWLRSAISS